VNVIIICYDITQRSTFKNLISWIQDARRYKSWWSIIFLAGLKYDLTEQRQVTKEEALIFASNNKLQLYECSSKTNYNIDTVILKCLRGDLQYEPYGDPIALPNIEQLYNNTKLLSLQKQYKLVTNRK